MSKLTDRIKKESRIKEADTLTDTSFYKDRFYVSTGIPIVDLAFSGRLDGGFLPGLTTLAGPSKHFKTVLGLACVRGFLNDFEDGVCIMYDSERGSPPAYLKSMGIDTDRVVHIPIANVEELKNDIVHQLENVIQKDDKVVIFIDSIGNLASKKELDDALDQKSTADMTRAKQLKSLGRMITPYLARKNIPCIAVNHTYKEMSMYPKDIVSGGTGMMYSSDTVFVLGKAKEKEGTDLTGHTFTINIEKSRFVKEGRKFPFTVIFGKGIDRWSGLFDLALETGHVVLNGKKYYRPGIDSEDAPKWWKKDTSTPDFWNPIIEQTDFPEVVSKLVSFEDSDLYGDDDGDS